MMERLAVVAANAFPPDFGGQNFELLHLSLQTLAMSILTMTFASFTGVVLSFLAACNFLAPGGILLADDVAWGWRLVGGSVLILTCAAADCSFNPATDLGAGAPVCALSGVDPGCTCPGSLHDGYSGPFDGGGHREP